MDKNLLEKTLEKPPNERLMFAELILASIDYEGNEIRKGWVTEVKSRMKAVAEGKSELSNFDEIYHHG